MNNQAAAAGEQADNIIKQLANPGEAVEATEGKVEVLDQAQPVVQDDWKKRFSGYKASTDSTIHALRTKVKEFDLIQSENESLKSALEAAKSQNPEVPDDLLDLFSEEEVKGVNKLLDSKVNGLQNTVKDLQGRLNNQAEKEARELDEQRRRGIVEAVKRTVPDYAAIDVDPGFKEYINEPDAFGNVRMDLLTQALNANPPDIDRIVRFYIDYIELKNKVPNVVHTQQELLQTPRSQPTSVAQSQPRGSGIRWDQATISQFYKDKATGKISPKDAAILEKELYSALGRKK